MSDYIPTRELAIVAWGRSFSQELTARAENFGFTAAEATAMAAKFTAFETAMQDYQDALEAARAAQAAKNAAKNAFVGAVRPAVRRLQASPAMTDELREVFGIGMHDSQPSVYDPDAPMPRVLIGLDRSNPQQHTLRLMDEANPTRRGKPLHVEAAEVYHFIGAEPPTQDSQWSLKTVTSKTRCTLSYPVDQVGKTAYFRCRWLGQGGRVGPWGPVASATIAA